MTKQAAGGGEEAVVNAGIRNQVQKQKRILKEAHCLTF